MSERSKNKSLLKIVTATVVLLALFAAMKLFNIQDYLKQGLDWVESLGVTGILVFVVMYIAACVFLIPGSILTLGAGAIFGVIKGSLIVSAASTAGATAAFLVGRYFARDWVSSKIEGNTKFKAIDEAVADEGWKIVGLTRLSPVFPFNLLNYAFGLTKVSLPHYLVASWIGMIPGTIMYVYMGSVAGDLASLGAADAGEKSPAQWAITIVGFAATVLVTVLVTKTARKALSKRID